MIKEEPLSRKQQATVVCHKKTCWLFRKVLHFVYSVETDDKWLQPTCSFWAWKTHNLTRILLLICFDRTTEDKKPLPQRAHWKGC